MRGDLPRRVLGVKNVLVFILLCTGTFVGSMLDIIIVWLIKLCRLSPSTSVVSVVVPAARIHCTRRWHTSHSSSYLSVARIHRTRRSHTSHRINFQYWDCNEYFRGNGTDTNATNQGDKEHASVASPHRGVL